MSIPPPREPREHNVRKPNKLTENDEEFLELHKTYETELFEKLSPTTKTPVLKKKGGEV